MMWLGIRAFIQAKVTGGLEAVAARLSPPYREFLSQMFVPTAWYDLLPIMAIAEGAAAALSVDKMEYVRRSAVWHAEQDMNGVYKALLLTHSPAALCKRFGSIHSQMYDFGKVQQVREDPNRIESLASGMPEPIAWWWKRASECYVTTVLRSAGAKNPKIAWQLHQSDGTHQNVRLIRIPSFTTWS
jgi:hypothetical protein